MTRPAVDTPAHLGLSVIICTHNPRDDYLRRALLSLQRQSLPLLEWEVLVVDNASGRKVSETHDLSWHPRAKHVREDELGLTAARVRGIRESAGDLIVFVDDDNVLDPDYLAAARQIRTSVDGIECFGAGVLRPEFEHTPSLELLPFTNMLALRTVPRVQISSDPSDLVVPWGAGLVVTRRVANIFADRFAQSPLNAQLGRRGRSLHSGEDDEFSWIACEVGGKRGLFPQLKLIHLIDKRRVQPDYLLRLAEGHAYSRAILCWLHGLPLPASADVDPSLLDICFDFLCLSRSRLLSHWRLWMENRRASEFAKALYAARAKGIRRGRSAVKRLQRTAM